MILPPIILRFTRDSGSRRYPTETPAMRNSIRCMGRLLVSCVVSVARCDDDAWKLWYAKPAAKWVEALPVGNGRLGAMVFGRMDEERIQLNEDTLWPGGRRTGTIS